MDKLSTSLKNQLRSNQFQYECMTEFAWLRFAQLGFGVYQALNSRYHLHTCCMLKTELLFTNFNW